VKRTLSFGLKQVVKHVVLNLIVDFVWNIFTYKRLMASTLKKTMPVSDLTDSLSVDTS
jgi:hypothetical protein